MIVFTWLCVIWKPRDLMEHGKMTAYTHTGLAGATLKWVQPVIERKPEIRWCSLIKFHKTSLKFGFLTLISLTLVNHALTYLSVEVLSTRRKRFKPVAGNSHFFWQFAALSNKTCANTHSWQCNSSRPGSAKYLPWCFRLHCNNPSDSEGCHLITDNFLKLNWTLPVQQLNFT